MKTNRPHKMPKRTPAKSVYIPTSRVGKML